SLTTPFPIHSNDRQLHSIIYLQVVIISQALIYVARSQDIFFMERLSDTLRVLSTWPGSSRRSSPFTPTVASPTLRDIIWFLPLDLIKFVMKATPSKRLRAPHECQSAKEIAAQAEDVPLTHPIP
ncbi:unnamed protein product, partial [Peniophora sp. CBMAI 1063]